MKIAQYLRLCDDLRNENEGEGEENIDIPLLIDEDYYWLTHCAYMRIIPPKEALFHFNYGMQYPQVMNKIGSGLLKLRCLAACSDCQALDKLTSHSENYNHHLLNMKVQS